MENQNKNSQTENQLSDETLAEISAGSKEPVGSIDNATVDDEPEAVASVKGHLFKFKKKKFLHDYFHHEHHE
ncbi:MAG: hypothetical protein AAF171_05835 [Cyanobacteria bacterium P01_A01_bin.116]